MTVKYYEEIFEVTETLQNGKERRVKKSVFCQIFDIMPDGSKKHRIDLNRIEKATEALKEEHFYNIVHIETKTKVLRFA